jgi:hypothetical protein
VSASVATARLTCSTYPSEASFSSATSISVSRSDASRSQRANAARGLGVKET